MDAKLSLEQAEQRFKSKEYAAAESLCADALVADPAGVPAHQLLARVYLAQGDTEKAREFLGRRDELPREEHYVKWGIIAEELEDLEGAMRIYADHLQRDSEHPGALYRLGMLRLERGERVQAVELLGKATRAAPEFAPAFFELARCFEEA